MAEAAKSLVVVVDGTAAMGPYWQTILKHYLEKIIRHLCGQSSDGQDASAGAAVQLGLIQYNSHGLGNPGCLVQASHLTTDVDGFLGSLSALRFSGGGGPNEAAIAEGLAEALVMFPKPTPTGTETDQVQDHFIAGERHCILVAASNPMLIPTAVSMPIISNGQFSSGTNIQLSLADAQTVAKSYAQCSVSLSVISPKQFPKLREIYNAGRNDPESEGTVSSFRNVKYPHFLVLLSNKFSEARAALDHSQSVIKSEYNVIAYIDPEGTPSFSDAKNPDLLFLLSRELLELRTALGLCEEVNRLSAPESSFETSASEDSAFLIEEISEFELLRDIWNLPAETYEQDHHAQNILTETEEMDSFPQAPSPSFTSEDIMSGLPDQYFEPQAMEDEDEAGETSSGHQILPTRRSLSPRERQLWSELYGECEKVLKASSSSMNIVSASPPSVSRSSEDLQRPELQTMELGRQRYHQNMESSVTVVATQASETPVLDASLPCSASTIQAELHSPQHAQQILTTRAMRGAHTSQRSGRDLRSPQTATSATTSGNSRVPRASSRTRRSPLGMSPCQPRRSQRIISRATAEQDGQTGAFGRFGESSGARTSVPKMPPRKGLEPPPASTSLEWEEAIYVPAWEGIISAKYQERLVLLTKAKVYKKASAPKRLTTDWPVTLQMGNVLPQAAFSRSYHGQAHDVLFEVKREQQIYDLLKKNELCVRFGLSTQTMIITPAEHNHFTGTVYAGAGPSCTKPQLIQELAESFQV